MKPLLLADGLRWQDLFQGMDSVIANNRWYNQGDRAVKYFEDVGTR